MTNSRCKPLLVCVLFMAAGGRSSAADPPAEAPKLNYKEWLAQRKQEFESYQIELEGLKPMPLTMEPNSLLNFSNPERGTFAGAAFLWTHEGRPELISCAYGRGQWLRHEFHSLSADPIVAERAGSRVHRFKPGLQWRDLPGAPEPVASRPLRLAQMRRQAERFRVTIVVQRPVANQGPAEMRLLPQPVYRSPETSTEDIAVFLFVQGTDPECALMLQPTSDKRWRYSLTRQTMAVLKVSLDDEPVLDLPAFWQQPLDPESAFLVLTPPEASECR
jgi:hypothetical protein